MQVTGSVLNSGTELFGLIQAKQLNITACDALAEYAARVCYASEARLGDSEGFITDRLREGHADVIEHGWMSFFFHRRPVYTPNRYLAITIEEEGWRISGNLRAWYDATKELLDIDVPSTNTIHFTEYLRDAAPSVFGKNKDSAIPIGTPPYVRSRQHTQALGWCYVKGTPDIHNQATFLLVDVSRSLTHQLVRHRLGSFCLSGDTVVPSFRTNPVNPGRKWTMRQLWNWQSDPKRKGRLKLMRLRGVNERGELVPVKIGRVIASGKQQLYKVTTESGRIIRSTLKHRYLSPTRGWCRLDELSVGDAILANGIPAYQNAEYLRQRYLIENVERKVLAQQIGVSDACLGQWIRKFGLQKPKSQYPGRKPGRGRKGSLTEDGRARLRNKRGAANCRWLGDAVGSSGGHIRAQKMYVAQTCTRCESTLRVQRHHIDGNAANNNADNIAILCELCHKAEHFGQIVMTVFHDRIIGIEKDAIEDTYDLEINDPCHCFVANGLVVHNSQQSQRYVDQNKAGWEYITPPSIANDSEATYLYYDVMNTIQAAYNRLRDSKIKKEDARYILPNAAATKIVVSMPFDALRHFIWLRALDKAAQWEIRGVAQEMLEVLYEIAPSAWEKEMEQLGTDKRLRDGLHG